MAVPLSGRRFAVAEVVGDYRYVADEPQTVGLRLSRAFATSAMCAGSPLSPPQALDEDLRRVVNAPGTICAVGAPHANSRLSGALLVR